MNKLFFTTIILLFIFAETTFAQWYVVANETQKKAMWDMFGVVVPDRQGNFATKSECEQALDNAGMDALQRSRYWCECEVNCDDQNSSTSYNDGQQNSSGQNLGEIVVDDYETQMMKRNLYIEKDKKQKAALEKSKNDNIKSDLLGKLKGNKSLDQLKTTSDLSERGSENITNNQTEAGRDDSESAFSQGKIKLKKGKQNIIVSVSPPVPVEHQKTLFEYIDRETKVVQTKIVEVQKEKIKLLEKKNQIQQKMVEQTVYIEKLKTEKIEVKEESHKEEIDSLFLEAMQLLEESETLNKKAGEELETSNKLITDQEEILNNLQASYQMGKENPERSEELLKELQGNKK